MTEEVKEETLYDKLRRERLELEKAQGKDRAALARKIAKTKEENRIRREAAEKAKQEKFERERPKRIREDFSKLAAGREYEFGTLRKQMIREMRSGDFDKWLAQLEKEREKRGDRHVL